MACCTPTDSECELTELDPSSQDSISVMASTEWSQRHRAKEAKERKCEAKERQAQSSDANPACSEPGSSASSPPPSALAADPERHTHGPGSELAPAWSSDVHMAEPDVKVIYFEDKHLLPMHVQIELNDDVETATESHDLKKLIGFPTSMAHLKSVPAHLNPPAEFEVRMRRGNTVRAGATLEHLENTVSEVLGGLDPTVMFKIGYAVNPLWRMTRYVAESMGWTTMVLLNGGFDLFSIQLMEAHLIRLFGTNITCQNFVSGGEGPARKSAEPCFYWVYLVIGDGVGPYGRMNGSAKRRRV